MSLVERLAEALDGKRSGKGWICRCPCHDDQHHSLSIANGTKGRAIVVKCHAGCPQENVIAALKVRGLWPAERQEGARPRIVATYDYTDENGRLLFQVVRFDPKDFRQRRPDGNGGWIWSLDGTRRVLYRLPQVIEAIALGKTIRICEGEKDVHAVESAGGTATTNPGGAGKWRPEYNETFRDARARVVMDIDGPGRKHARAVAAALAGIAAEVNIVLPRAGKDAADHLAAGHSLDDFVEAGERAQASVWPAPAVAPTVVEQEIIDSDIANALRFAERYSSVVRWTPERGWLIWDGKRWQVDVDDSITALAKVTAKAVFGEVAEAPDEAKKAMFSWARQSQKVERIKAMLHLARSELGIPARWSGFDADPWLLACCNGTVDLRTGELRPASKSDLLSRLVPIDYDPKAEATAFDGFLERVQPDAEMREFVQRATGYTLTALTGEQCLFFHYGRGANGKSVFLEVLKALLGEHAVSASMDTFAARHTREIPNDIARLAGARLVTVSEVEDGVRLREVLVKDMTGEDTIPARFLHREFFEFQPRFKIWIRGNHRPVVRGTDDGIWRRIRLIPWTVQIPEADRDPYLLAKLKAELPGILAWAVRGCLAWQRDRLRPPQAVMKATKTYRDEMDVFARFIEERCVKRPNAKAGATVLYREYVAWCDEVGERVETQRVFGGRLGERGFHVRKTGGLKAWFGVGLRAFRGR